VELTRTRLLFTAAPLLLLAGQVVHPEEPSEGAPLYAVLQEHRTSWLAAHLLLLAGVVALGPVLLRLAHEIRLAAPRLSVLSAVAGVAGSGAASALFGGSLTLTDAGRGSEQEMVALLDRVLSSPVQALFLLVPGMLVAIAVTTGVLAAVGVVSRAIATMAAVGFAVGVAAPEPIACLGTSVLVIALWKVAGSLTVPAQIPAAPSHV
jgi:hypothetical protein